MLALGHRAQAESPLRLPEGVPDLGFGFNVSTRVPRAAFWPPFRPEHARAIRAAGFHHVRLRMEVMQHADPEPPYRIAPEFFEANDEAVRGYLAAGLKIVLCLAGDDYEKDPANDTRVAEWWRQLAAWYRRVPDEDMVFDLLVEPNHALDDIAVLNRWHVSLTAAVRETNPRRTLIYSPGRFSHPVLFDRMVIPEAAGEQWLAGFNVLGHWDETPTSPNRRESFQRARFEQRFAQAARYQRRTGRPVYLAAWGCFGEGSDATRLPVTRAQADLIRKHDVRMASYIAFHHVYEARAEPRWTRPDVLAVLQGLLIVDRPAAGPGP